MFPPSRHLGLESRASTLLIIRHAAPARFAGVDSVGAVSCIAASGCSGGTSSSVLSAAIGVLVSAAAGIEDHVPCTLGSWPGTHVCDPCPFHAQQCRDMLHNPQSAPCLRRFARVTQRRSVKEEITRGRGWRLESLRSVSNSVTWKTSKRHVLVGTRRRATILCLKCT